MRISRELPNVQGNVWWHGYWVTSNMKGVADSLAMKHQSTIALPPAYGDKELRPAPVENIRLSNSDGKVFLSWTPPHSDSKNQKETDAVKFMVYQFFPGEKIDLEDSQAIISMTPLTRVLIGDDDDKSIRKCTYVVTSVDRMNRESEPARIKY